MNLQEAQDRLKNTTITEEQLQQINPLYILLDIDKDDFCKIVDTVGLETLLNKSQWYTALINKLDRLCDIRNDEIQQIDDNKHGGITYVVPKSWIKVSPPKRMNYTDEQKKLIVDRLNSQRKK